MSKHSDDRIEPITRERVTRLKPLCTSEDGDGNGQELSIPFSVRQKRKTISTTTTVSLFSRVGAEPDELGGRNGQTRAEKYVDV